MTENFKCWRECGVPRIHILLVRNQNIRATLENSIWRYLIKLNTLLPYASAIPLLGIYPKEIETYVHTKTCTQIFISKTGNLKFKCLSNNEWISKLWYIHTVKGYTPIRDKILIYTIWINLKNIMLGNKSWTQKTTYHMILNEILKKSKL